MEQNEIQQTVKDILTQHLVQSQMRRTPERYAILRTIYEQKAAFSAQEIYDQLDSNYHVSLATVYNAINLFIKLGLVVRCPGEPLTMFEKCYGVRDHFQQVCTHCGRVTDFQSKIVSNSITMTHFSRFRAEHATVCVYGICSKCQAKMTRQLNKIKNSKLNKNEEQG